MNKMKQQKISYAKKEQSMTNRMEEKTMWKSKQMSVKLKIIL